MSDRGTRRALVGLLAGLGAACAHAPPPDAASNPPPIGEVPPARRPDGVSFDLAAARAPSRPSAPARGVIALYAPPAREDLMIVVRAYFRAFASGNERDFTRVLSPDAQRLDSAARPGANADLAMGIEHRLGSLDYQHAPIEAMVRYEAVRVTPYEVAAAPVRAANAMLEGDELIDVAVDAPHVGNVALFAPHVLLVLRREGKGRWRIAGVNEEGPW